MGSTLSYFNNPTETVPQPPPIPNHPLIHPFYYAPKDFRPELCTFENYNRVMEQTDKLFSPKKVLETIHLMEYDIVMAVKILKKSINKNNK